MVHTARGHILSFIPSPPINGFHLGSLYIHFYGLMYVIGIGLAIYITRRRWRALGGNPDLVTDVAIWGVPAGIIGGRIYFDLTTPADIPHVWYGIFAVWSGGLGIWGGVAGGALAGVWRVRRAGQSAGLMANAVAPALLVAQAIGRIGNYFNQELFGRPSTLPWAVQISAAARARSGMPAADMRFTTFQPSFLYELIFDLACAAFLVWLSNRRQIRPWGLFALYVAGYSAYRIFEETIRIDSSQYFFGMRLNFWVAIGMTLVGLVWFAIVEIRGRGRPMPVATGGSRTGPEVTGSEPSDGAAGDQDMLDEASAAATARPAASDGAAAPGSSQER